MVLTEVSFSEPFKLIASDIVGSFGASRHGCKFIVMAMCLASKYSQAVPRGVGRVFEGV